VTACHNYYFICKLITLHHTWFVVFRWRQCSRFGERCRCQRTGRSCQVLLSGITRVTLHRCCIPAIRQGHWYI